MNWILQFLTLHILDDQGFTLNFDSKENNFVPFYINVKLCYVSANVRVNSYIYNMKLSSMVEHSAILSFISCTDMHLIFTVDIIVRFYVPGL